ncbi:uncharacterized protein LOC120216767 [Hibiscus syriacus]|uniref:uncharacterized protein LOC120216767 n=1 Tax=Hibiscus syriacus TaxID=106335 RepID=UPI0019234C80|nr:uncharacterized protein LOC120216767 [Hibiscus syriacus]
MLCSPAEGASGGLILLWDSTMFDMRDQVVLRRILAIKGSLVRSNLDIGLVNVYGPNVPGERKDFFEILNAVITDLNSPIILGGDFNVVRSDDERVGVCDHLGGMNMFEDFISTWDLVEVPNVGSQFTWFRGGMNVAASRLDRFLVSVEIVSLFPLLTQTTLPKSLSNHIPIILKEKKAKKFNRPFKWFNHWAEDSDLVGIIKELCERNSGKGMNQILELVKDATKVRESAANQKVPFSVGEINKHIDILENRVIADGNSTALQNELYFLKARLWAAVRKEEHEWLQKLRLKWFRDGDKNTRFFHLSAVARGRINLISKLKISNTVVKSQVGMQKVFVKYFSSGYKEVFIVSLKRFGLNLKRLNSVSRRFIERPFSEEEVWLSIKGADESRAPGPDGFNLDCFKKF